jgi:hypothetical protein
MTHSTGRSAAGKWWKDVQHTALGDGLLLSVHGRLVQQKRTSAQDHGELGAVPIDCGPHHVGDRGRRTDLDLFLVHSRGSPRGSEKPDRHKMLVSHRSHSSADPAAGTMGR